MLTVEQATDIIQKHLPQWNKSITPLKADRDYPPIDRIMMDGIALSFEQYMSGQRIFKIEGIAPAGTKIQTLKDKNCCMEVMTGAALPINADLIIPYEQLEMTPNHAKIIQENPRTPFEFVHKKSSDCLKGAQLLPEGMVFNGPHAGICASLGFNPKSYFNPAKVLIISTGNELVEINQTPEDHQLRRSNVYAIEASLRLHGFFNVELNHLADDAIQIAEHFKKNVTEFDILIYSGAVSKGKFDYLPNVWNDMGVTKYFHEVSQRPGKPLWFGVEEKNKTVILGLPGNPVSSLVCLHRYLIQSRPLNVVLKKEIVFKKALTYFLPVTIKSNNSGQLEVTPLNIKNSGEFTALSSSDGFIELPKDQDTFQVDEVFKFYAWRGF